MIGFVTLGTRDLARAAEFYDALLGALGAKRIVESEREIVWAKAEGGPAMRSRPEVDALYAIARELGAADEGAPGPRGEASMPGTFAISTATS